LTTGAKLSPRGEVIPWGVKFSVCPSILLNSRKCSPLGVNEGVNIPPRGQILPLEARGEVKNSPQENIEQIFIRGYNHKSKVITIKNIFKLNYKYIKLTKTFGASQ
jgi:hypothetical protein